MKYYRLQLIPLTRVHVGMGSEIGPLEYTLSNNVVRYFNTQHLSRILAKKYGEAWRQVLESENVVTIRRYIYEHFPLEAVPCSSVLVAKSFVTHFTQCIRDNDPNNQLLVNPFIRPRLDSPAYLPGSAVKGALRTALISGLEPSRKDMEAPPKEYELRTLQAVRKGGKVDATLDPFRVVKISDYAFKDKSTTIYHVTNMLQIEDELITAVGTWVEFSESNSIYDLSQAKRIWEIPMMINTSIRLGPQQEWLREPLKWAEIVNRHARDVLMHLRKGFSKYEYDWSGLEQLTNNSDVGLLRIGRFSGIWAVTDKDRRRPQGKHGTSVSHIDGADSPGSIPPGWVAFRVLPA